MKRKEFIKKCGWACLGLASTGLLLQSCATEKVTTGNLVGKALHLDVDAFVIMKNDVKKYRKHIIIHNEKLQYPICVFRHGPNEYKAVLMRCTHQGSELQVFGDRLVCPAHGSEFTNLGGVANGPAELSLRTFPVEVSNNELKIPIA